MRAAKIKEHAGLLTIAGLTAALTACVASRADTQLNAPTQAVWRHHQTTIYYQGLTVQYSCTGFRDDVRAMLLYLGARPDLKVQMVGCDRGFNQPGRTAAAQADFYTVAPADSAAGARVPAHWSRLSIRPYTPYWLGFADCELIMQLKSVITTSFALRHLSYQTACTAHSVTVADYGVTGEILKAGATG